MSKNKSSQKKKIQEFQPKTIYNQSKSFIEQWSQNTKKQLNKWRQKNPQIEFPQNFREIWLIYLQFINEYMIQNRFNPESQYSLDFEKTPNGQQTLKSFMLELGFLNLKTQNQVNISISNGSLSCLNKLQDSIIMELLILMRVLSLGFININNGDKLVLREIGRSAYNQIKYYSYVIQTQGCFILALGMQRIPHFSKMGKKIEYFQAKLCIQIESFLNHTQKYPEQLMRLDEYYKQNIRFNFNIQDYQVDQNRKKPNVEYFSYRHKNNQSNLLRKYQIQPYKRVEVNQLQSLDYQFNLIKYQILNSSVLQNEITQQQQQINQSDQINYLALNYQDLEQYVREISSIPNFKFKLTKQQKQAIKTQGSSIVIGRSGTGKTLLSIIRLFSIEYLTRKQMIVAKLSTTNRKIRCPNYYLDQALPFKNAFLTASPYLIEEIYKQYQDMNYQIQADHKSKCQVCEKHFKLSNEIGEDDNIDALLEKIEKRQNVDYPISSLDKHSFPLFLTIKSLIKMIDYGLKRPFFNIEQTKKLENKKKVVYIYWQKYYRLSQFYQGKFNIAFKHKQNQYDKKQKLDLRQQDVMFQAIEVDYQIFEKLVWIQISETYYKFKNLTKKLNPSVVWIQIFSVIKGSAKAHITPLKCLSPSQYIEESKNHLLSLEQKIDVYHLFEDYQIWKIKNSAFDQMDVVNHILDEIMLNKYQDILLDYMFIDEVQDLPPATIYLITKMSRKDIFYCGDTAQAISKGVSFKFSQIKTLYSPKYFEHYIQKDITNEQSVLTVNFRSHNRILILANYIVQMIQQLFPKMIDVLQKQQSDLFGPTSILINKQNQSLIYDLLVTPQNKLQKFSNVQQSLMHRYFSSEQVVLVRNSEQKDRLPAFLKKELVLTCEEVKGLQYNDIVIYNFFGSSTCKKKWELLDYLDIHQILLKAQQFESRVYRRKIEQGKQELNQLEFTEQEKLKMGYDFKLERYRVDQLKRSLDYQKIDLKNYYEISNELKKFYTLVTRAKNIVVIYDKEMPRQILRFLTNLNLIKIINPQQVSKCRKQLIKYSDLQNKNHIRYASPQKLWNEQGLKMLARKNYDEAEKCFKKSGNTNAQLRTCAMRIVDQCQIKLIQLENQMAYPQRYTRQEFKLKKLRVLKHKKTVLDSLSVAAENYKKINLVAKAADLYKKCQLYQKAKDCYLYMQKYEQAADCWYKLKEYQQALKLYDQLKKIEKIFDCLIILKKWEQAYQLIIENKTLVKQMMMENRFEQSQLILCFGHLIKSALNLEQNYRDQITMNSGYGKQQRIIAENIIKKQIIDKSSYASQANLNAILNKQNLILLNFIAQKLVPIHKSYIRLQKQYKNAVQQFEQSQIRIQQIKTQLEELNVRQIRQSNDFGYENIVMSLDFYEDYQDQDDGDQLTNQSHQSAYLHHLFRNRREKQRLNNQLQSQHQVYQWRQIKLQQAESNLQQFTDLYKVQQINSSIKNLCQFGSKYIKSLTFENQKQKLIQNKLKNKQIHIPISNLNNIYKSYLHQYTILRLLGHLQEILIQAANFIEVKKQNNIISHHHQQTVSNIQYYLCYKDNNMNTILKMYKLLQKLNCYEACYLISDYYFLPYHFYRTVLNEISSTSNNLLQNRKVKYVLNADKQKQKYKLHVANNQKILNKIGNYISECTYLKKITNQYLQQEYILKEIIDGLILLGFYQNTLSFLNEEECFRLCYLYMDYQKIVEISVHKARQLGMKLKEQMYYCFLENAKNTDFSYINLTNVFSMQKIFYDFDCCESRPILSKPVEIQDLELQEQEIDFCQQLVQYRNNYYQIDRVPFQKAQIERLQRQYLKIEIQTQQKIKYIKYQKRYLQVRIEQIKQLSNRLRKQIAIDQETIEKQKKKLQPNKTKLSKIVKQKEFAQRQIKKNSQNTKKLRYDQIFIQKSQFYYQDLLRRQWELDKFIKEQQNFMKQKQREKTQKIKEDSQHQTTIRLFESQINKLSQEISDLERKIKLQNAHMIKKTEEKKDFIRKCRDKNNSKQRQQQILKEVIKQQKQKKANRKNKERRKQIAQNIQKGSNLSEKNQLQYKLLSQFVRKNITIQNIRKDSAIKKVLLATLKNTKDIEFQKISDNQICLIIIVYLQFLFHQQFRQVCLQLCQIISQQNRFKIEEYTEQLLQRNSLYTQHQFYNRKINQKQNKLKKQRNTPFQHREKLEKQILDLKRFNEQVLYMQILQIDNLFKIRGLNEIFQSYQMIQNLLKLLGKLKNIDQKNIRFIQIFLGFFQCRLIRNCKTLSFLEGGYVFVDSKSILLKSMKVAKNQSFGYYFDCSNKVILTHFNHVYNAIIAYLQMQYKNIYPQLLDYFNTQKKEQLKRLLQKKLLSDKNIFCSKIISDDGKIFQANLLVLEKNDQRGQLKKIYYQYCKGALSENIFKLKQQVLQFYLSKQRRQHETLYFTLFQLKQYNSLQHLVSSMPMYNYKLLKEVKTKLKQLESAKNSWISKEHLDYQQWKTRKID